MTDERAKGEPQRAAAPPLMKECLVDGKDMGKCTREELEAEIKRLNERLSRREKRWEQWAAVREEANATQPPPKGGAAGSGYDLDDPADEAETRRRKSP